VRAVPSELTTGCSDQQNKSALKDTMGLKIPEGRPGIDKEIACTVLFLAVNLLFCFPVKR
jgi:hypothetical protein